MTMMRRILFGAVILVAVVAAYIMGASGKQPVSHDSGLQAANAAETLDLHGLKVPEQLPTPTPMNSSVKIVDPAKVLSGDIKVPNDLLRTPPPASQPNFIVPDISR